MTKKIHRVIDIPVDTTAGDTEKMLNDVADEGYYLTRLYSRDVEGGALRALFTRRAKPR